MGIRAVVGAELTMEDKCILPILVANRTGYKEPLSPAHRIPIARQQNGIHGLLEGTPCLCGGTHGLDR